MRGLVIAALVVSWAVPATLLAGKGKKKEKDKGDGATVVVRIADDDREVVRRYFVEKHGRGNCPPGLAKKNNGCLPPGLAKKRYLVGQPLPSEVVIVEPPVELTTRLRPCPPGYRYVIVDGDLVELVVGTQLVVDAIEGLVR